ncbi:MAG: ZIP family metal transporter [Oscillospiraceae bacterium]|jgi:ZIP family zinc transporter|nr:ZIP family metal transporter [Oscillospiraceae bacterium]
MALVATIGTWFITALGAATVVFFRKPKDKILNVMLGFAAGVMIAASFWSLLQPAIERAEQTLATPAWLVAASGFLCGAFFIWASDKAVSFAQHTKGRHGVSRENARMKRIIMLIFSITLHNIPEGLAVGVAFGALAGNNYSDEGLMGAISIAIGIGLQNFPEGAAVALPLRREGVSRPKSFFWGQVSAIVEPIAGVIGAALVMKIQTMLPFALAFAAGAMIIVSVHELIPESQSGSKKSPYSSTMGIISGFAVMMMLDVMFG